MYTEVTEGKEETCPLLQFKQPKVLTFFLQKYRGRITTFL